MSKDRRGTDIIRPGVVVTESLFSVKRLIFSLLLAALVQVALSYQLAFHNVEESLSLAGRLLLQFSPQGLPALLIFVCLTAVFYLWFLFFGDRVLFSILSLDVLALLFGFLNTAARHLFFRNMLPWLSAKVILVFLVQSVAWGLLFLFGSRVFLYLYELSGGYSRKPGAQKGTRFAPFVRRPALLAFLLILLCWLPWIISYYPASMEWDVYDPIMRYLGLKPKDDNHPWFYTTVIGSFYALGLKLGNKNIGIFIYIVVRALILAAIYAHCISQMRRCGLSGWLCFLTALFYAVTPVWGAYAKHAFKDTISAALFCWLILSMVLLVRQMASGKMKVVTCVEYAVASLGCCLFRHNAMIVAVAASLLLVVAAVIKKQPAGYVALLLCGLFVFQGYHAYIYNSLQVDKPLVKDTMSMFYQQTARTVKFHYDEITEQEREEIGRYLDYKRLPERYDPIISDPVKNTDYSEYRSLSDYYDFLGTWARIGLKYPYTYLEAFIAQSSGYYAFTPDYTEAQRYGPGSHTNVGMTIFDWVDDDRFPSDFTCRYLESLEGARLALANWAIIWHKIPVFRLTDSKPLYTWLLVLMVWQLRCQKKKLSLIPVVTCLFMVLTCVFMPVNDCFRYFAPVAAAFPPLLILLFPSAAGADPD